MDFHFFANKLINLAGKNQTYKIKKDEVKKPTSTGPLKAGMGPEAYLATVNQPSGAHQTGKNDKWKTKRQDIKQKLRREVED